MKAKAWSVVVGFMAGAALTSGAFLAVPALVAPAADVAAEAGPVLSADQFVAQVGARWKAATDEFLAPLRAVAGHGVTVEMGTRGTVVVKYDDGFAHSVDVDDYRSSYAALCSGIVCEHKRAEALYWVVRRDPNRPADGAGRQP